MVDYAFQKAPVWTWNSTGRANITTCSTFYPELFWEFYPYVKTHSERVIDSWGNYRNTKLCGWGSYANTYIEGIQSYV